MKKRFKGKYRIDSMRKQYWNYAWCGKYFITLVLKDRPHWFGEIVNEKMHLSEMGRIAKEEWEQTPTIRPDMNIKLDTFQVMPEHFHAIIEIGKNPYNLFIHDITFSKALLDSNDKHGFSIDILKSSMNPKSEFGPQRKNLSSIIRGFKSAVTIRCREINPDFAWLSGYHDELIPNDEALEKIRWYIRNNPKNWGK